MGGLAEIGGVEAEEGDSAVGQAESGGGFAVGHRLIRAATCGRLCVSTFRPGAACWRRVALGPVSDRQVKVIPC